MLTYQLSSFVNHPPKKLSLTVTVFYSIEDEGTVDTLAYFSKLSPKMSLGIGNLWLMVNSLGAELAVIWQL